MTNYPDGIFTTWERMVRQEETVGIVTAENIGKLAAWLKCTVDYSTDVPELIIKAPGRPEWRVPVDMQVKPIITEGRPSLSSMSGFNRDNTWTTATEEAPQVGSEHGEWSCRDPRCGVLTYAAEWCPGCGGSHVSPASETEGSR